MKPDPSPASACSVARSPAPTGCPFANQAAAFDPYTDAYMANPSELLRWAREEQPVFFSPRLGYWVLTRYASIKDVFRDPHTYSPSIALESTEPPTEEALGRG